jgi:hypothetical protein
MSGGFTTIGGMMIICFEIEQLVYGVEPLLCTSKTWALCGQFMLQ